MDEIVQDLFTYENLVHAISGATGGVTAITTFYPLNMVRLKVQTDENYSTKDNVFVTAKKIAQNDGIEALYQGWQSAVISLGASNFVYFYTYNAFKSIYKKFVLKDPKANIDTLTNLLVASSAGVINVLATTPLWVAGTRLTVQNRKKTSASVDGTEDRTKKPYTGVLDCLTRIIKEEGVAALWKGVGPSLILVSNPSIQFVCYEQLRIPMAKIAEKRGTSITSLEFFVMGAIAKALATVFTYPLQIAQSRLRADRGKEDGTRTHQGTVDVLKKIYAQYGVKGWFKGMEAKLWQTVLTAAFQFLTYEQVQKVVLLIFLGKGVEAKNSQIAAAAKKK
mmetsp:Transcript_32116/g.39531  ORF Transcript_32116/g.39531 Transcript_32116/m.39531 type:complete len:336 (-) Transcript_32116:693-1700(-)|eukprot:CAMPEP_0204834524 /NCGR_PEP_ID=MMETSP1346-20131115/20035_1 /ASSEMBLY_ACC=CAM_ASM_000771 /TAXON_ID=215587 /ORGANISM="Aplanochytrium stocchinoi, Strain GSBS06" /LENGTH=335 /DNA_ID=CAMNT_0051967891 /DNA_START=126 /DNA_END=1133 /DNA_ORIENTATION=+